MFTIRKTTAALVIGACCGIGVHVTAHAQTPKTITIPAGDLKVALERLVEQTGVQLLYDSKKVAGLKTDGVDQASSAEAAVVALLKGTSLSTKKDSSGAILISALETGATTSAAQRMRLAQVDTSASSASSTRSSVEEESMRSASDAQAMSPFDSGAIPEILVEGKRSLNMDIQRSRDDPQPYVIFDREKLEQSGAQNLETFLRDRLPMNANGMANGQRPTQFGTQSSFNLRGLGAGQTLILVDGHRIGSGVAYSNSPPQSDLNGIPLAAVERIEVLPATASGIYGGGATGGVINIILKHDYAGVEAKATYGNSIESDVAMRRIDVNSGFNLEDGKTNVLLTASYSDQNPLTLQERPELVERYYSIARANAPASLLPNNLPLGATPNIRSANGSNLVLRATGQSLNSSFTHIPAGYMGTASDNGAALLANAGAYNFDIPEGLQHFTGGGTALSQTPENASVRASVQRAFSPNIRAFLEGSFNESETYSAAFVSPGASRSPYRVSSSAPNNPFTTDILVTVPTDSLTGHWDTSLTQTRLLGGVVVSLPARWQAEMDYTWARTRNEAVSVTPASTGADAAAILTGAVDVLRDTAANPIDLSSLVTQSTTGIRGRVTFQDIALRLAGPVLDLPAGPITVATLLEYREEDFAEATQRSGARTLLYPERSASVSSAYLEAKLPVVSAQSRVPGVQEIEVQLAVRADEYRTRGSTGFVTVGLNSPIVRATNETSSVNPTLALRYQPVQDLVVRASYGTGFVAPNVSQLAGSINVEPFTIRDPRRGGANVDLQPGQILQGGNADLGPEKSESWSAGLVLTPRFLPDLRLSLDYTRIDKTDNIATYPTGVQGLVNDEALFPGRFQRGPNLPGDPAGWAGPITLLNYGLFNIARAQVEAFDLQLDYQWITELGTIALSTVATRQTHYLTQGLRSQPMLENVDMSYANPAGFTGSAELKWQYRGWTTGWLARYYDDYFAANPTIPANAAALALQGNGGRVPSQTYHDLFINWKPRAAEGTFAQLMQGTEFQLSVRNIFDELPPFDGYTFTVFQSLHSPRGDALGTTYQLSMTKRF